MGTIWGNRSSECAGERVNVQMASFQEWFAELGQAALRRDGQPENGGPKANVETAASTQDTIQDTNQDTIDVPREVLRFAPKKIRRSLTAEDRIDQLESEVKQWQDRADEAEARLRRIEKTIQKIAAELVPRSKKTTPRRENRVTRLRQTDDAAAQPNPTDFK